MHLHVYYETIEHTFLLVCNIFFSNSASCGRGGGARSTTCRFRKPAGEGQSKAGLHLELLKRYFETLYFFRAVLGSHQNWEEGAEILHIPPSHPHTRRASPSISKCTTDEPTWHIMITQSPQTLDKCVMLCIHHYSTKQEHFTALKILCVPSHPPPTLGYRWLIFLPFPEFCFFSNVIQFESYSI